MFKNILDVAAVNGFLKQIKIEKNSYCKIGPVGLLLQNNLKTQWFNHVVINKDVTVFPSKGNIQDTFDYAKKVCLEKVPFGIAEMLEPKLIIDKKNTKTDANIIFQNLFEQKDQLVLKSTFFVPSTTATQFFHQWQKQRRMWWRKVSCLKLCSLIF